MEIWQTELLPYVSQLMMSIIVASTAFMGITAIVMGQIIRRLIELPEENREAWREFWSKTKGELLASFIIGGIAVLFALLWFIVLKEQNIADWFAFIAFMALLGQLAVFSITLYYYWKQG